MYPDLNDLNGEFAEVFLIPHILVSLLKLIELENLLVNNRLDLIRLNRSVLSNLSVKHTLLVLRHKKRKKGNLPFPQIATCFQPKFPSRYTASTKAPRN